MINLGMSHLPTGSFAPVLQLRSSIPQLPKFLNTSWVTCSVDRLFDAIFVYYESNKQFPIDVFLLGIVRFLHLTVFFVLRSFRFWLTISLSIPCVDAHTLIRIFPLHCFVAMFPKLLQVSAHQLPCFLSLCYPVTCSLSMVCADFRTEFPPYPFWRLACQSNGGTCRLPAQEFPVTTGA